MAMEEDARRGYCYAGRESTLKHMLCGGNFLTRPPTADIFHPHYPPSDCPSFRASSKIPMFLPSSLLLSLQGVVWIYPLLRASTVHILIVRPSDIHMILPSLLLPPQGGGLFGSQLRTSNEI